jgi:hypothetical protein
LLPIDSDTSRPEKRKFTRLGQTKAQSVEQPCVFVENVKATADVASIPYVLVSDAVMRQRLHSFVTAERIRALKRQDEPPIGRPSPEDAEKKALEIAWRRFSEVRDEADEVNAFAQETLSRMRQALDRPEFDVSASELLLQAVVMLWGSLETLAGDLVRALLNHQPRLAALLVASEKTRNDFPKSLPIESMEAFGFRLHDRMGDFLLAERPLQSLPQIRRVFNVIAQTDTHLRDTLSEEPLWHLWQRRHVIVHRRGIIDAAYLKGTGEGTIGERLIITSDYLDETIPLTLRAGRALLCAAKCLWC